MHKVDETRTRTSQNKNDERKPTRSAPPPTQIHCAHAASTQHSTETRSWLHRPLGPPHASASRVGPAAQHAAGCAGDGCTPSRTWTWMSHISRPRTHSKLALREGRGRERKTLFPCVPACLPYCWRWREEHPPAHTHARTPVRTDRPDWHTYDATPDLRFAAPDCRAGRAACLGEQKRSSEDFCWLMRVGSGAVAVRVASAEAALVGLADHSRRRGAVQGTRDDDDTIRLPADCSCFLLR